MRIFVYGSLKLGCRHHDQLGGAPLIATTTVAGYALYRVGAYPAMAPLSSARVRGEVYEADAELLRRLDDFEDCPELYQRVTVAVAGNGEAYAYVMGRERVLASDRIEGDTWVE